MKASDKVIEIHKKLMNYKVETINRLFDECSKDYPVLSGIREETLENTSVAISYPDVAVIKIVTKDGNVITVDLKDDFTTLVKMMSVLHSSHDLNKNLAICIPFIMPELQGYEWNMDGENYEIEIKGRREPDPMDLLRAIGGGRNGNDDDDSIAGLMLRNKN